MDAAVEQHELETFGWNIQSGETATKIFTVDFSVDDRRDTMTTQAVIAENMPQRRQSHPAKRYLVVVGQNVTKQGPNRCVVTISYASVKLNLDQVQPPNVVKVRWYFTASQEEIDQDINARPLLNSADEYFETPISRTFNDITGQFTYRTKNYDPVFAHSFMDHVNGSQFLGFAPGIAKLVAFSGDEIENDDGNNWNISIEIQFRADGWKRRILDQGYRELTGVDDEGKPTYRAILDDEGEPIRSPVTLNGSGVKKLKEAPASYLIYEVLDTANFDLLGLG